MIGLLTLAVSTGAFADEGGNLHAEVGAFELSLGGALGAQWLFHVGDDADTTQFDAASTESVMVAPSAVEGSVRHDTGVYARMRFEEGKVHAAEVEAAEARVGFADRAGVVDVWIGRGDAPITRDREMEAEDLALGWRPVLSRSFVPLHMTAVAGRLTAARVGSFAAGASYASSSSDAPWLWTRASLHPLGQLPDAEFEASNDPTVQLAAGVARLSSPALGDQELLSADAELRWSPGLLMAGWTRWESTDVLQAWTGAAGAGVPVGPGAARAHARVERITGLDEVEDARWITTARVGYLVEDPEVEVFVEAIVSREQGTVPKAGPDVVVLDRGVERANDLASAGVRMRW